jgi:hypothetical protein
MEFQLHCFSKKVLISFYNKNIIFPRTSSICNRDQSKSMRGAINGAGTVPFKSNSVQPFISGIRAAQYLIFCVVLAIVCHLLYFSCGHCVVCPSLIYSFWLHLWYLQTLLTFLQLCNQLKYDFH